MVCGLGFGVEDAGCKVRDERFVDKVLAGVGCAGETPNPVKPQTAKPHLYHIYNFMGEKPNRVKPRTANPQGVWGFAVEAPRMSLQSRVQSRSFWDLFFFLDGVWGVGCGLWGVGCGV